MWFVAIAVGIATGILSGMGIGGGTLLVLYLTTALNIEQSTAAGINLLYFLGCAPSSLVWHVKERRIAWHVAIPAAASGAATALAASLFAPDPTPDWLQRCFGILLIVIGLRELYSAFHTEKKSG